MQVLAHVLSSGYYAGLSLHKALYKRGIFAIKNAPCMVISVGNITVGGTGKTPFTLFLANLLKEQGKRVAVIVRGYKSKDRRILISDGKNIFQDAFQAGDEGYLLAKRLENIPVLKEKRRYLAVSHAYSRFRPDVIILDDAFQHWALKRDLDIVLLDAERPFSNGHLLPRGKLREPISALARADTIVLTKINENKIVEELKVYLKERFHNTPIFIADYVLESLVSIDGTFYPLNYLKDEPVLTFCAISKPEGFKHTCSRLGVKIKEFMVYPDHYYYGLDDLAFLQKKAKSSKANLLLTTEKDAVKIRNQKSEIRNQSLPIFYPRISVEIKDKQVFYHWLREKLGF